MASRSNPTISKSYRGGETDASKISQIAKVATPRSSEQRKSPRPGLMSERRLSAGKNSEFQQTLDPLSKLKENLASAEEAKVQALEKLNLTKKLSEELSIKLNEVTETSKKERSRAEEIEHASLTAAEDWQAELEAMKRKYNEEVDDLQTTREIIKNLKQELLDLADAKNEAVKLAREAMIAAEVSTKRAEEISAELNLMKDSLTVSDSMTIKVNELIAELSSAKESLLETHIGNEKLLQEGVAILAAKDDNLKETFEIIQVAKAKNETLKQELAAVKEVDSEATDTRCLLDNLKIELALAEELKLKASSAVADAQSELEKAKVEFEQVGITELKALTSLTLAKTELEEAQEDLRCKLDEKNTAADLLSTLQNQLEINEIELENIKNRELHALAKVSDLTKELSKCQKQLADSESAKKEAMETIQSLSISMKNLMVEAEEAKQELLLAKVEAVRERELALAIETEVQMIWGESGAASEIMEKTKSMNVAALDEARETKLDAERVREESEAAKVEAERIREETEKARAKAQALKEEVLRAQEALQTLQKEAQKANASVHIEREEADCARENAQAASLRVEKLEAELKVAHLEVEGAALAAKDAECTLQDALREMEALKKLSVEEGNEEASEGCDRPEKEAVGHVSQEEYNSMKVNLQEAEVLVAAAMAEVEETKANAEMLARKLETTNKNIEISKLRAVQEHQELQQAQKTKSDLEAEVRRLNSAIKQQQNCLDITTKTHLNSGFNGNSTPALSLEMDPLSQVHITSRFGLQNDDAYTVEAQSSASKKKKALFLKLRAYLAAKVKNH